MTTQWGFSSGPRRSPRRSGLRGSWCAPGVTRGPPCGLPTARRAALATTLTVTLCALGCAPTLTVAGAGVKVTEYLPPDSMHCERIKDPHSDKPRTVKVHAWNGLGPEDITELKNKGAAVGANVVVVNRSDSLGGHGAIVTGIPFRCRDEPARLPPGVQRSPAPVEKVAPPEEPTPAPPPETLSL